MIKRVITYTDFDGNERTEEFYFNLTKSELLQMELSTEGGMKNLLERIVHTNDVPKLVNIIKELVLKSYGEKSLDGKRFIKNSELSENFVQTLAYDELLMQLLSNSEELANFCKGILPPQLLAMAEHEMKNNPITLDN